MSKVYYDSDADLNVLKGKTVAIVGYGSQGKAQAHNLHDSGVKVVVALRPGSPTMEHVKAAGLKTAPVAEATQQADIIQILIPDEWQGLVYKEDIAPHMKKGKTLMFSHGFNIHFNQIVPPKDVDIMLVAPKSPGPMVRKMFEKGAGVPGLIAIHQDASGKAKETALAYAKGIGCTKAGVFETSFREETETDLFGEQAVLCGGCSALIKAGFETLVEAGYQPEMAYFECLHELKLIVDLIYEKGITGMREAISNTAEYGDLTVGPYLIDETVKSRMKHVLSRIQNGVFAKEWIGENQVGRPVFNALAKKDKVHLIERVGEKLRAMMPWLKQ